MESSLPEGWVRKGPMHEFTSMGDPWYFERRDVDVHWIAEDSLPDGLWQPRQLTGTTVLLDGKEVEVAGVNAYAIMCSPERPYSLAFGIAVKHESD